eukprot:TRINITY_DN107637_c0_g1_i1.p1 TRINITY_DN107637_c0_g1~~TRINITY_DN107637_c0_g1_i1.p1  ORF type:complete len:390 (-),score=96.10 TRINITY_DN107637_c0_g1_i1:29-1198(-)
MSFLVAGGGMLQLQPLLPQRRPDWLWARSERSEAKVPRCRPRLLRRRAARQAMRRRETAVASAAAGGMLLGFFAPPRPARAGPFVDFLSDFLPVRETRIEAAKLDASLRDSVARVSEKFTNPVTPPEVLDAPGAEAEVMAAGAAAAAAAGLDRQKLDVRIAELQEQEPRRLRGRAAAGLFESELLGSVTGHMAENIDRFAFRAYIAWKAYSEALKDLGKERVRAFRKEFARRLLASKMMAALPPKLRVEAATNEAELAIKRIQAALQVLEDAGLCGQARLREVDEVLVDIWASGGSQDLALPALIEGDPLVDAQIILSEERASPITPDPILAVLTAWLEQADGPGYPELSHYYVNSRWRGKSEYADMVYVRKQRLFQFTLHRQAAKPIM